MDVKLSLDINMGCKASKKNSEVGSSLRENPENIVFHSLGILDLDAYYGECEDFLWEIRSIYNSLLTKREILYTKLSLYSISHRPTPELSIKALILYLYNRKEQVEFTEKLPFIQSTSGFEGLTAYLDFVNCLLLNKDRLEIVYVEL